jgi:hypothetical protein
MPARFGTYRGPRSIRAGDAGEVRDLVLSQIDQGRRCRPIVTNVAAVRLRAFPCEVRGYSQGDMPDRVVKPVEAGDPDAFPCPPGSRAAPSVREGGGPPVVVDFAARDDTIRGPRAGRGSPAGAARRRGAEAMGQSPLHLTARDFDAYAPEKATSNAYSRPRLEVKQRALAWARGVVARLGELGISVDVHGSDEHPSLRNKKRVDCQWVFFWRDPAAREELERLLDRGRSIAAVIDDPSPYTRHAFLGLRLDTNAVEVCFAVHPEAQVDVDNLRARLAEDDGALAGELIAALRALPEEFAIGVTAEDRVAAHAATPEVIRSMIERAAAGQMPLWVGWSVKRETAIEHSALLDEQLEDALIALAPIYKLVAWSRQNDHLALDRRIQSIEEERQRAHAEAEAQTEKWRAEQAEARRKSQEEARARAEEARAAAPPAARRPSLDTLFGPPRTQPAKPAAPATPAPKARPAAPPPAAAPKPAPQAERPPRAEPIASGPSSDKPGALDKGSKVRVRSGPFADKVGVIGELDGKGGARVLLGLLSTRLDLADLEPVIEGRAERPAIQSSHRKPIASRNDGAGSAPRKAR